MFANWEEVFESFSEIEKDKIRAQQMLKIAMERKYLTLLMNIGFILGRIFYGH